MPADPKLEMELETRLAIIDQRLKALDDAEVRSAETMVQQAILDVVQAEEGSDEEIQAKQREADAADKLTAARKDRDRRRKAIEDYKASVKAGNA